MKGTTSYKDTKLGILPRQKVVNFEIEGVKRGLEFIHSVASIKRNIRIDSVLICKLHKVSFGWIFPDWAGKYRKIQVTFSEKEAPEHYKIPELMTNLCGDLEERLKHLPQPGETNYIFEIVRLLSWFQHAFVFIHPFNDYNGRTARMLTIIILLNLNLPAIEIKADIGKDRTKYINAMREADNGNYSELENLISEALVESLKKIGKI